MASVTLDGLEVAARLQELVGRAGMPKSMEYDLLELRVGCPPLAVPLGQQLRRDGQTIRQRPTADFRDSYPGPY